MEWVSSNVHSSHSSLFSSLLYRSLTHSLTHHVYLILGQAQVPHRVIQYQQSMDKVINSKTSKALIHSNIHTLSHSLSPSLTTFTHREFTNGNGQTVLLQLYSPSGGFTYPHRQLLGKLFGESDPKGYWVSAEAFDSALKRKKIHYAGKLKRNAWTLSALVNVSEMNDGREKYFPSIQSMDEEVLIANLENKLIEKLAREKVRIINAIKHELGATNIEFHFHHVDLTDESQPAYEPQIAALGFFATNYLHPSTSLYSSVEEQFPQHETLYDTTAAGLYC